jgi:putative hydroxymethylpyrimidine transport system substrate-binding protein
MSGSSSSSIWRARGWSPCGCRKCGTPPRSHDHADSIESGAGAGSRSSSVTAWPSRASIIPAASPQTPPPSTRIRDTLLVTALAGRLFPLASLAVRIAAAVLLVLALAGCGSTTGQDRPGGQATLLLDFAPNAVHAGLYLATSRGYDEAEGVELTIHAPGQSTDALKLLESGRADMAILDIHDLGLAREQGHDIVGVMAFVQRPLAAVLAQPSIRSPRDLEGERAGVTGLPSDDAVLDSIVSGDGGDPAEVRKTTIGFQAVKALLAGRVEGATAFWNAEGVALKRERPAMQEFRVDDYGAPPYPELVLCVTRATLEDDAPVIRATIRALQRGYGETQRDPESAVAAMREAEPRLDEAALTAELDAVDEAFTAGARAFGQLKPDVLRAWARWDVRFGILAQAPDIDRAFDTTLVGPTPPT